MNPEFTVQIYVPAINGVLPPRLLYPTNLNGKYRARFVGCSWVDDIANHAGDRVIFISSSQIKNPYGSRTNTFMINNHNEHNLQSPGGSLPFEWDANGPIDLEFSATIPYDNTNNNTFKFCILSFEVRKDE